MKKNYKTGKHKSRQITASLYTKIYKLVIFRLLPQANAHLSLRSTTCLNQSSQEITGHGFTKSRITAPNWNHLFSLYYATTIHLEFLPWRLWNPLNLSHLCHVPKEWETFHSISQGGWQMILITLRWKMQPHWMQKTVLTTFIEDPLPISPPKRSWHLTQDPKWGPHIYFI